MKRMTEGFNTKSTIEAFKKALFEIFGFLIISIVIRKMIYFTFD